MHTQEYDDSTMCFFLLRIFSRAYILTHNRTIIWHKLYVISFIRLGTFKICLLYFWLLKNLASLRRLNKNCLWSHMTRIYSSYYLFVAYKSNANFFEVSRFQGGLTYYIVLLNMFIELHQKFLRSALIIEIQ